MTAGTEEDTIAALVTPPGHGGVGIVRISGARARGVLARVVRLEPSKLAGRRLVHAVARDPGSGERLDDVLVVVMEGPASFTGEDVVEIQGHGGPANMGRLLAACVMAGARLAGPGEFSRRAFQNRRLDLLQVEAVADVIAATSERGLRAAQGVLAGALGGAVRALHGRVIALVAEAEADLDFPTEGLEVGPVAARVAEAAALAREVRALADTYAAGRALREGLVVALVGAPNVGKSSLLNALLGEERALVAEEPGTTRDVVEARTVWHGVTVTVLDTAGDREAESAVERRGVELGRRRAAAADVVVEVLDASRAGVSAEGWSGRATVRVWNKCDLRPAPEGEPALAVSARTGLGVEALRQEVVRAGLGGAGDTAESGLVASERQRAELVRAAEALEAGVDGSLPAELLATELRAAALALGAIVGDDVSESVLDAIFARFCIGK